MAFTYPTVVIASHSYEVYGGVADAIAYLIASLTTQATAFIAATSNTQSQALVSATRWLDAAQWQGTQTDLLTPQALQWPRSGISNVDPDSLPDGLVNGCFELAAGLVAEPDLRATLATPLPRSLTAGSANISYFRPDQVFISSFFPPSVMSLVGQWMAGSTSTGAPIGTGYTTESPLDDPLGLVHGF